MLGIDPWLINPVYSQCAAVDGTGGKGLGQLQTTVDALLAKVRRKYKEYGINEKPFVTVKADNGRPAMGIMTVRDTKDLDALQRRVRHMMVCDKDCQPASALIFQEGVLTRERLNDAIAEPVVYM